MRKQSRQAQQALREHIESRIVDGTWPVGTQLPTEREMSGQFGISRNTVRRLLSQLDTDGWIERRVGCGTFVRSAPARPEPALDTRAINPEEVMEARLLIEPLLAKLVVLRASEMELDALQKIVAAAESVQSMAEFEHWDNQLHRSIAQASKNQYLINIVEGIHRARQSSAWAGIRRRGLTDERRLDYQADHARIVAALVERDGDRARDAMAAHLSRVRNNLIID